jgi:hypothetical protein
MTDPILVTGCARSGTSMVAGCLRACGAWTGDTIGPAPENLKGFVEHLTLRETVLKPTLRALRADTRGVKPLPSAASVKRAATKEAAAKFRADVQAVIQANGYHGGPWLYKDAKLSYLWPLVNRAFPKAFWIIVHRDSSDVVDSCLRTNFMRHHSLEPEFWLDWYAKTWERLVDLGATVGSRGAIVGSASLVKGERVLLAEICDKTGLEYNQDAVDEWIDGSLFGGEG